MLWRRSPEELHTRESSACVRENPIPQVSSNSKIQFPISKCVLTAIESVDMSNSDSNKGLVFLVLTGIGLLIAIFGKGELRTTAIVGLIVVAGPVVIPLLAGIVGQWLKFETSQYTGHTPPPGHYRYVKCPECRKTLYSTDWPVNPYRDAADFKVIKGETAFAAARVKCQLCGCEFNLELGYKGGVTSSND